MSEKIRRPALSVLMCPRADNLLVWARVVGVVRRRRWKRISRKRTMRKRMRRKRNEGEE